MATLSGEAQEEMVRTYVCVCVQAPEVGGAVARAAVAAKRRRAKRKSAMVGPARRENVENVT